jgi:HSP20 family protein
MSTKSNPLARRESGSISVASPFSSIFQRWNDEMDRLFDDFGFGRFPAPRGLAAGAWSPQIEVSQRGNELIVRAELAGLKKDDVHVDIKDDVLTIQGERKQEHEEEREGVYRSERQYGSFYRVVPLPEGTIADSAKATFKNGVLEITLQAPPREVSRGRRLEIKEA